jgi:hypothetical protein
MQNIFTAALLVFSLVATSTFAGECANGTCVAPVVRPVRKVVNVTREVIVAPFRAVAVVAAPKTCCCESTASIDACAPAYGSSSTKEVVKYQPLRRRLVNRTTNVSTCQ